ncbi:biopolymer transporter ExbD [Wohlfahrtiimonas chitiniclastica]|uniref:Biopolymer transporter ExbD n=1 Tax=Wohlfahrtiimonas chitiniclastica TaxID=400946 RepID=A0AB35BVI8_9GAMM|nr:biopolymer transporter ExbD [Wohlfahrtiimonas chitiniclastica]MBS7823993.1 biopolymer transporter ExbD [Wohlfahrtiimonas chitiniclastica]MBS7839611.1 biopolymer transporter ExbD [Wohlfahrtiimonas chitiniclastica]
MAIGRIRSEHTSENAEINMVPLIDVMLVLLVIFIITAPMVTQSVDLSLPKAANIEAPVPPQKPETIEITKTGEILLNQTPVTLENLHASLEAIKAKDATNEPIIALNIDESVPYDTVAKTLIEIKRANLSKIGFITTVEDR